MRKNIDPVSILMKMTEMSSQADLACRLGVSPSLISDVLRGARPPTRQLLKALGLRARIVYERAP